MDGEHSQTTGGDDSALERLLAKARQQLLETGTRNRLIHVNRDNKRANALTIINERSDDVFDILKCGGKRMRFLATGTDRTEDSDDGLPLLEDFSLREPFDETRYTDNRLETPLGPDALQKRLLRLARDARTAEEEQGINILFLALGFLTWFEDKNSDTQREAPLILLPVDLVRNERTSTYDIRIREEDIATNLPLQERLKGDFGIDLPEIDADAEDFSPSSYFDRVDQVIDSRERWRIDRDGMQLGFFSFAKLLMLKDLEPDAWGEDGLTASPLLKSLLMTGFENQEPLFAADEKLDERLAPHDIIQVVDADASQTKVIEEVRAGRNLVVQGPPGTGKSQTITNIIASAVHDGKSVLFVAEKMAALSVVHGKLNDAGLRSICLELHSRAANKKKVVGELARTLADGAAIPSVPDQPDRLQQLRDTLNGIAVILHRPVPEAGGTPFEAMSVMCQMAGIEAPPPKLRSDELAKLDRPSLDAATQTVRDYAGLTDSAGSRRENRFRGTGNLDLQPTDLDRLADQLDTIKEPLRSLAEFSGRLAESLGVDGKSMRHSGAILKIVDLISAPPPDTLSYLRIVAATAGTQRLQTALAVGQDWQASKQAASEFVDAAWHAPAMQLRSGIAHGVGSFLARLGPKYRSANRELSTLLQQPPPRKAADKLRLVDKLVELQQKRRAFENATDFLEAQLAHVWKGEKTPFLELLEVANWYEQVRGLDNRVRLEGVEALLAAANDGIAETLRTHLNRVVDDFRAIERALALSIPEAYGADSSLDVEMSAILDRLEAIEAVREEYAEWCGLQRAAAAVCDLGLGSLVDRIDAGELDGQSAQNELVYARAEALWTLARKAAPELDRISETDRHRIVTEFQRRETDRIGDVRKLIRARHLDQLPTGGVGEMAVIRGEINRKTRHKPIRKLFTLAGPMLQRIKPVLLMSPISVAQFLPPRSVAFDLLVIDEASQVRPEDAFGAIARARQIVVVGDQKQLPPTSFFDELTGSGDDEEDDEITHGAATATEMESILSLCEARSVPSRMLEWHYRSRDPSLIQVSNDEFYRTLVLPPSPLQQDDNYGLRFKRVPGAYTSRSTGSGRPGTNRIEAQAIVDAIASHAANHSDMSLGVVTFSSAQRNMVTELLELERRQNPLLDDFLREGKKEDVFVKNIENVQGDERDIILISVGYGPHEPGGRLPSMSFGPVNKDGGERRLNVLFSRARARCDVFASFDPGDIDLGRTQKEGPRILKKFLRFAQTGQLEQSAPTGEDADSPFEEDVAKVIRGLGYDVDHQVGSAGFKIDLGVKHPDHAGQYMMAVECDGASYHGALWARERDRLRQEILEHLGWRFHRIWSTDWFYRRGKQIERLKQALDDAASSSQDGIAITGANEGYEPDTDMDEVGAPEEDVTIVDVPAAQFKSDPYEIVRINVEADVEPHEAPMAELADIVRTIVDGEGPIHQEEVARRLAAAFGKERAGRRILDRSLQALEMAKGTQTGSGGLVKSEGHFWFTDEQERHPRIRNRSAQASSLQRADMLPPMEIAAAVRNVVEESGNALPDDIIRAVARTFGFERVGPTLRDVIGKSLEGALAD